MELSVAKCKVPFSMHSRHRDVSVGCLLLGSDPQIALGHMHKLNASKPRSELTFATGTLPNHWTLTSHHPISLHHISLALVDPTIAAQLTSTHMTWMILPLMESIIKSKEELKNITIITVFWSYKRAYIGKSLTRVLLITWGSAITRICL